MIASDEHENLTLAADLRTVDEINSRFYGKYPFPWPPATFERVMDPALEASMLNQSIGSWSAREPRHDGRIWVAGCGTNQSVITALKFPSASITATDLSESSLQTAADSARQLGLKNIDFRRQSINETEYEQEFDYIICTGVIHHNADPSMPLRRLHAALKPTGICELMVYNKYHRIWPTAFQRSVQIFMGSRYASEFELSMDTTRRLMGVKLPSSMGLVMSREKGSPASAIADLCMQPVERSYTVESLEHLLSSCGFEYCSPCVNHFDKGSGQFLWNIDFTDAELRGRYESLTDSERWQITNLLMLERSPMLWFYIRRTDSGHARKSERQMCEEFLARKFRQVSPTKIVYVRNEAGRYEKSGMFHTHPAKHSDASCRGVLAALTDGEQRCMQDILEASGAPMNFAAVNRVRLMLTTCAFPYLICNDMPT